VLELTSDKWGQVRYRSSFPGMPLWWVLALSTAVGVGLLVVVFRRAPWYTKDSCVEYFPDPNGIRLVAGRAGARHPGLVVRRGDVLHVALKDRGSIPSSKERSYRLTLSSWAGSMKVDIGSHTNPLNIRGWSTRRTSGSSRSRRRGWARPRHGCAGASGPRLLDYRTLAPQQPSAKGR